MCTSYALVATSTDYDSWRPHEAGVTVADVFRTLSENAETARHVTATVVEELATAAAEGALLAEERGAMQFSIMPRSEGQKKEDREKLAYILPEYFRD